MSHRRTRAAWVIGTGLVAFAAGLTAGRHLDREWRWQGGALERGAPTSTNASRASVPAAGEAKAERASNNPWPDEGKAGVYVVEWRDELAIEDDPTLKERVAVFERSPEVTAARCYAPGPAPTDVYVVWNDADRRSEVHMVKWYSPAGDQGTKFHQVVSLGGPARSAELVFLDVNGDGRKEVITLHAGNAAYLVILDFGRPWGRELVLEGLPGPRAHLWEFADLDGNGRYECVATTYGRYLNRGDYASQFPGFRDDETLYMIYRLDGDEYPLCDIVRDDPTETLH